MHCCAYTSTVSRHSTLYCSVLQALNGSSNSSALMVTEKGNVGLLLGSINTGSCGMSNTAFGGSVQVRGHLQVPASLSALPFG